MILYLVRHGKAQAGPVDDVRALSPKGRKDIDQVAKILARVGVALGRIEHSPLVRARETAEIFGRRLNVELVEASDLRYDGDVYRVREHLWSLNLEAVMLVGHNPFMERLAALLVCEDPEKSVLIFHTSTVAVLAPVGGNVAQARYACDWLWNSGF